MRIKQSAVHFLVKKTTFQTACH